ncbi:MAG: V-type ATP synthase subunit D [Candidatus Omnitrophica bacterium]|nr:V-type ATP synthase subunit D [Candidatus Omnitrophota bacterium]
MNVNIPATKTNLLKIKRDLSLTRQGYELLDEKRRILMQELTSVIDSVDLRQKQVDQALSEAYRLLDRAVAAVGTRRLEELSFSVDIRSDISISQRRIMGVTVPVISLRMRENPPYYSLYEVNLSVDEAMIKFKEALKALAALAEKKITLLRLAEEARRTIRKVNALEKIYIPYYSAAFKYIADRLDEESRDAFALLKLIKQHKTSQS